MESFTLPSFPPKYSTIHICLFENVQNSTEIKKRLIEAAITEGEEGERLRKEVDFGFIESDILVSKEHLLTSILTTLLYAFPSSPSSTSISSDGTIPSIEPLSISSANESSTNEFQPKTRTHNLHSEILLSLTPYNNNISESIRRNGISNSTTNLIVVKITDSNSTSKEIYDDITKVVMGELIGLDRVEEKTDWGKVDKIYKLSELNSSKSPDLIEKKRSAIISQIAIKNVI